MLRLFLLGFFFSFLIACEKKNVVLSAEEIKFQNGKNLLMNKGCLTCHSLDGQPNVGPTFKKLYGKSEKMTDGTQILVDESYLKESILKPNQKIVSNYQPVMPAMTLTESEVQEIISTIKLLQK